MGQDIMSMNGGSVLAMRGKNCVVIGCDSRLGNDFQTVAMNWTRVFPINNNVIFGMGGLGTDIQTMEEITRFQSRLFELREIRSLSIEAFAKMTAHLLYEHRFGPFFIEPVFAGLKPSGESYVASSDSVGALSVYPDFTAVGTAAEFLMGVAESLWRPDLGATELADVCSQALLAGINRDALSGWGATIYIMTPEGITERKLQARQD